MRILILLLMLASSSANAGLYLFTTHSRANCLGFNESISWHKGHYYKLMTTSYHFHQDRFIHALEQPWDTTWRSAAYHMTEGYAGGGWAVTGLHYQMVGGKVYRIATSNAHDCSFYDGWWS